MIPEKEAREKAMEGLRFDFGGNMLSLGKLRDSEDTYVYSIFISYPRLPETEDDELEFDKPKMVGEISINKSTGEMYHTPSKILNERVGEIKNDGDIQYTSE